MFYSCLDAKTQPAHTPLRYSTHISAACVHKLGSCTTHRPHTPTTLEHHLRVRFISCRSKALHVSESKLAHNDIIVWGPQGVQTQVHPKALVVACPLPVAPLWVTLLLHFLSCRRSVVQRCTMMAAPADGEAPSFPGLAERLHEAMRVARLGQKNLVVESARPGFKRHPTSGTRSHWGFGDGIVPIVKPY